MSSKNCFVVTQYGRMEPAIDVEPIGKSFHSLIAARQFARKSWAEGEHELVMLVEQSEQTGQRRLHYLRQSTLNYEPKDLFDGTRWPVAVPSFALPFQDYLDFPLEVDQYRLFYGYGLFAHGNAARTDTIRSLLNKLGDDTFDVWRVLGFSWAELKAVSTRNGVANFIFDMIHEPT